MDTSVPRRDDSEMGSHEFDDDEAKQERDGCMAWKRKYTI